MNLITTLGGVGAILIGGVVFGIVIAVGLLPFVFWNRKNELSDPEEDLKDAHSRMSAHV